MDKQAQLNMFGMTIEAIDEMIANSIAREPAKMIAMSMLSDAQELIAIGRGTVDKRPSAEQLMNVAKYIIDSKL